MQEHIRNLLAIATNERGVDEIVHARVLKELERHRGAPDVDEFFKRRDARVAHAALKQRILKLKKAVK